MNPAIYIRNTINLKASGIQQRRDTHKIYKKVFWQNNYKNKLGTYPRRLCLLLSWGHSQTCLGNTPGTWINQHYGSLALYIVIIFSPSRFFTLDFIFYVDTGNGYCSTTKVPPTNWFYSCHSLPEMCQIYNFCVWQFMYSNYRISNKLNSCSFAFSFYLLTIGIPKAAWDSN